MANDRMGLGDHVSVERLDGVPVSDRFSFAGQFTIERYDAPLEWYALDWAWLNGTLDEQRVAKQVRAGARSFETLPAAIREEANRRLRADLAPYDVSSFPNGGLSTGCLAIWNL